MRIKKLISSLVVLTTVCVGLIICVGPASAKNYSLQQADGNVIEFQTLSPEDVKFAFLANIYYSESKLRRDKVWIAGLVYQDLAQEAKARRQANMRLNTLEAEITGEFEKRLAPELNKYSGKVFRARIQDKGIIGARILSPNAKNLAISTDVLPHPFLWKQYRSTGTNRYSGLLESVGGSKSSLSLQYPYMAVSVELPVSRSDYQKIVYETQKAGRDRIQYTMEFLVDFTLNCAEFCDFKVLGSQVLNYSLK